jgi:hypothetical protein
MIFEYIHHGRCFECGELTGLNKDTLMCPKHDYAATIQLLRTRLASAEEALGFYANVVNYCRTKPGLFFTLDQRDRDTSCFPGGAQIAGKRAREHFRHFPASM